MTNSLVYAFEGYVESVFLDILPTYGSTHEWRRDKNRTLHELGNRGMRLLTIDFPALRKHLDKCLEDGLYTQNHLYLSKRVSSRIQVPRFCRDLYIQIFDVRGKLRSRPNVYAIADLRQLYEGVGKLRSMCSQKAIEDEIQNFIDIEDEIREPDLNWQGDCLNQYQDFRSVSYTDPVSDRDAAGQLLFSYAYNGAKRSAPLQRGELQTLQRVCDYIVPEFGDMHLERECDISSERPKHGTGRVANLRRDHSKYDFAYWPSKLERVFPYDRYATHDMGYSAYDDNEPAQWPRDHEEPSKLIAVPKTASGPRLIGSEPNYHQWVQQLILNQIVGRLPETVLGECITLDDQSHNARMALEASVSGAYATVDLKSASDRLSCWTIERAFRSNISFLERIHASRTRTMLIPSMDERPRLIRLQKCFTQGSACTFPVQSLVYAMISIAASIITEGGKFTYSRITQHARDVRVFGDDIVVPTKVLPKLVQILDHLGLRVNDQKTFHKGKFRESCGMDAYDGVNVTPARIRAFALEPSHEVAASMLEGSNNFHERGMWFTADWLKSHLRSLKLPIVPVKELLRLRTDRRFHVSGGYGSFCGASVEHLKKRYNRRLFREEVSYHVLTSNSKKVATQSAHDLTEYLFRHSPPTRALDYLEPVVNDLGVVNKEASVMKQGWKPY